MFELLIVVCFGWLMIKTLGLVFKLTWGAAKIAAGILVGLACPILILCLIFVGGLVLLIPLIMVGIAAGIVKACL